MHLRAVKLNQHAASTTSHHLGYAADAFFSIVLEENPLADFVELPEHLQDLRCITHLRPPPAALAVLPRVPRRDM